MSKIICPICKIPIVEYKTINKGNITYSYGTCACELEYNKYCDILSSYHKRIDRYKNGETKIWNLRPKNT